MAQNNQAVQCHTGRDTIRSDKRAAKPVPRVNVWLTTFDNVKHVQMGHFVCKERDIALVSIKTQTTPCSYNSPNNPNLSLNKVQKERPFMLL